MNEISTTLVNLFQAKVLEIIRHLLVSLSRFQSWLYFVIRYPLLQFPAGIGRSVMCLTVKTPRLIVHKKHGDDLARRKTNE